MTGLVRFQSPAPNRHGRHPGVFALANGLRDAGRLSHDDVAWLRDANARRWFRTSALHLLLLCEPYLALLDRYEVAWMEVRTTTPGRITDEDDVQVIAVPQAYPGDWPFAAHPGHLTHAALRRNPSTHPARSAHGGSTTKGAS